jgi:hypothetical protein
MTGPTIPLSWSAAKRATVRASAVSHEACHRLWQRRLAGAPELPQLREVPLGLEHADKRLWRRRGRLVNQVGRPPRGQELVVEAHQRSVSTKVSNGRTARRSDPEGIKRASKLWRRRGDSAAVGAAAGQNAQDVDELLVVACEAHAPVADRESPFVVGARQLHDVAGRRSRRARGVKTQPPPGSALKRTRAGSLRRR